MLEKRPGIWVWQRGQESPGQQSTVQPLPQAVERDWSPQNSLGENLCEDSEVY